MSFDSGLFALISFVVMLFVSIAVHETMHAYVAYRLGDDLAHSRGRISLNPLHHIDPVLTIVLPATMLFLGLPPILAAKPVPINTNRISGSELGLAAVGVAGPLTNLALATVAALIYRAVGFDGGVIADGVLLFVRLNVALFVFNMLPLPPLDGSRLLYAIAPPPVQHVMERIEQAGIFMAIALLFLLLPLLGGLLGGANTMILQLLLG